jgi:hypothetical protein
MISTKTKKIWGRFWLGITLLLMTGAHYFFYRFSSDPLNTYRISGGVTCGCVVWTSVLWVAMWLRHMWARYLTITVICIAIASFCLLAMLVRQDSIDPLLHQMKLVAFGVLFYVAALIPLTWASMLRQYLGPKTAGER